MIYVGVLPEESVRETAAEFIEKYSLSDSDTILYADEEDGIVGYTAIEIVPNGALPPTLRIKAAQYTDTAVLELMLRSAFSYGERRYADEVLIDFSQPSEVLAGLGFRQIDGQLKSRINNVVHMCRNSAEDDN